MMRPQLLLASALCLLGLLMPVERTVAAELVGHFRFGLLRPTASGGYELARETTRVPRKLKGTGFRWGLAFDNPTKTKIVWYEVVRLPSAMSDLTGNYDRGSTLKTLRTQTQMSDQPTVVDDFWFDEGDPLGHHRLDLYVNGKLRYSVEFEVVDAK
jgi:hypothetical protein